jgi:hypothetical protein
MLIEAVGAGLPPAVYTTSDSPRKGSKAHMAVDTLEHLLALCVTAADQQGRARTSELAKRMQEETGQTVEIASIDQGYTGENAADAAEEHGVKLEVAQLSTATEASSYYHAGGWWSEVSVGRRGFAA